MKESAIDLTSEDSTREDAILQRAVDVGEAIGKMLSPVLEVAVHDLRTPDESIIAIYNGHVTGREIGDGATDLGRRRLQGEAIPDKMIGYSNKSPNGKKMKSSSLAIRDDEGKLIGAICLNLDLSYIEQYSSFINRLTSAYDSEHITNGEDFGDTTPREDIQSAIEAFLIDRGWIAQQLSSSEKREVVEHLYRKGHFKKRGAVTIIADELGLVRSSVYNYRNDYTEQNGSVQQ
jgi:predicted transcriptional regulator YheO